MVLIFKAIFAKINHMNNNNIKANRILSALIDGLLLFVIFILAFTFPLIDVINEVISGNNTFEIYIPLIGFFFLGFFLDVLYLFITMLIFKGATLGMKLCHLTYIKYDGTSPKAVTLFFHAFSLMIGILASFGLAPLIDMLSLLANKMGKSFHDILFSMKMVSIYDL